MCSLTGQTADVAEYRRPLGLCSCCPAPGKPLTVGYDLEGIRHPRVQRFIEGMLDGSDLIERLRGEIPDEFSRFRDLDFREGQAPPWRLR